MDFGFWIAIIFGCAKFVCVWKTSHQSWSQPFGHEATLALCTTYDVAACWERRHLTAALIWFELRIGQFSTLCFAINGNMMASFFCRVLKMPMMGSSLWDSTRRKVQGLWVTKTYSVLLENFLTKNLTQVPDSPVVRACQTSKQRLYHGFAVPQVELSDLLVCSSYLPLQYM